MIAQGKSVYGTCKGIRTVYYDDNVWGRQLEIYSSLSFICVYPCILDTSSPFYNFKISVSVF